MPNHSHRSGALRQTNKKNKRKNASKRSRNVHRVNTGAASSSSHSTAVVAQSKASRKNTIAQKRQQRKQALLNNVRFQKNVPRVVGIIGLGDDNHNTVVEGQLRDYLVSHAQQTKVGSPNNSVCAQYNLSTKTPLTIYTTQSVSGCGEEDASSNDDRILHALDLARICDTLVFVLDDTVTSNKETLVDMEIMGGDTTGGTKHHSSTPRDPFDHLVSATGDRLLSALKGQGLPTPLTVLVESSSNRIEEDDDDMMTLVSVKSVRRRQHKRALELKKYVHRLATTEFGSHQNKVLSVCLEADNNDESSPTPVLLRTLLTMSCTPPKWVSELPRPYIVADSYQHSETNHTLEITGYIRGMAPLDVHNLLHVPKLGTYHCQSIVAAAPPFGHAKQAISNQTIVANPELREPLQPFATPNALEGEQNLVGFDDDEDDNDEEVPDADTNKDFARPVGWSDYQSAWLDALDESDAMDHGELANELNNKSVEDPTADMEIDEGISEQERRSLMAMRQKEHDEEAEFPDEVQVKDDEKARERFARYRPLKSFRKSVWDPKENLPDTYADLYHFSSFKQTQRSVLNDVKEVMREAKAVGGNFFGKTPRPADVMEEDGGEPDDDSLEGCVPSGSYVTLRLENVTKEDMSRLASGSLLTAVSLLEHENKVSVLHMGLSQSAGCDPTDQDLPIKSKDVLTFRCGWRTWQARPVFSQNNLNCDKHKLERFLPTGGAFFAASVFGPATYSPCPVLVFRGKDSASIGPQQRELVAIGSMLGADADRIVIKRIILTGYPVRVHKRHATVKYMFYDPEDVKWFKPAGLHTKHGLQGNIIQSVGEHGTMKCLFNAPIKQHDTVCLPLYKRMYPKYAPVSVNTMQSGNSVYKDQPRLDVR